MAIDFPNSPTTGDLHTVNGKQWQWDAEKWIAYGVSLAPDVLKVDSGNNRVGINQTSPAYSLDVTGTARITGDLTVQGTTTTIESAAVNTSLVFEGATADAYETTLTLVDPTADRTITLPDATGTLALARGPACAAGPTVEFTTARTKFTHCLIFGFPNSALIFEHFFDIWCSGMDQWINLQFLQGFSLSSVTL